MSSKTITATAPSYSEALNLLIEATGELFEKDQLSKKAEVITEDGKFYALSVTVFASLENPKLFIKNLIRKIKYLF
jgi:hypothetical protein